jgi:uncharacterized protein YaaN involved in tellurite resistance|tara:strand:+ start:265 stop:417 length:153 start_codon:yes stop_codon:yes gene_type:complete
MNDRGPNDLEQIIEKLEKRVGELKKDNETLIKEIDRLSEYNTNLERMMKK